MLGRLCSQIAQLVEGAATPMRNFFENRKTFAVIFSLFALALACNVFQGAQPFTGHLLLQSQTAIVAHGPIVPPDPWAGTGNGVMVAHGPIVPPDPWAGTASSV